MKKLMISLILSIAFAGLCFSQNSNIENNLVGTWFMYQNGDQTIKTWIFNSNGTISQAGVTKNGELFTIEYRYSVNDNQLIMYRNDKNIVTTASYTYYISNDRNLLLLESAYSRHNNRDYILLNKI